MSDVRSHASAIISSDEVAAAVDDNVGVVLLVSSLTPGRVGGGTAVVGFPSVSEEELLRMLSALVEEMRASARRARLAAHKAH